MIITDKEVDQVYFIHLRMKIALLVQGPSKNVLSNILHLFSIAYSASDSNINRVRQKGDNYRNFPKIN